MALAPQAKRNALGDVTNNVSGEPTPGWVSGDHVLPLSVQNLFFALLSTSASDHLFLQGFNKIVVCVTICQTTTL